MRAIPDPVPYIPTNPMPDPTGGGTGTNDGGTGTISEIEKKDKPLIDDETEPIEPLEQSSTILAEKSEEYDCEDGYVYEQLYPRDPNDNKFDCSEWAYYIIAQVKPTLAKEICSSQKYVNTTKFIDYITANGGFRINNPKVGDIVMWTGHIEFVTEVSGEKFVMHGFRSASEKYCPPDHFGKNDQGIVWLTTSYQRINSMGFGTFLGFWTP